MDQINSQPGTNEDGWVAAKTSTDSSISDRELVVQSSCQSPEHPLEGRSILVAEDSDDMWRVTQIFLNRAGAETDRAANGKEAVEKASEHDYSAILMDMQMPVMDGLEATRRLRANGCESPILAFTTNPHREHASASLGAGCDEHLMKPLSGQKLVQKIADYCTAMDEEAGRRFLARSLAPVES